MILSNNQSRATLCFLETCVIVGLLPLKIILITASWSWYTNNKQNFLVEEFPFEGRKIIIVQIIDHSKRLWSVERTSRWFVHKSLRTRLLWFVFPRISKIKSPKSIAGIPSILNPASKEMLSHSVETVRNWNLFLTHPTYWNKHVTSKNAQCSTWWRIWILKISCKIGTLKQFQSALFSTSHVWWI